MIWAQELDKIRNSIDLCVWHIQTLFIVTFVFAEISCAEMSCAEISCADIS